MHPQGDVARATKLGGRGGRLEVCPDTPPLCTHLRDRRRELRYTERGPKAEDDAVLLYDGVSPPPEESSSLVPPLLPDSSDEKVLAFALGTAELLLQTLMACTGSAGGHKWF